ncbi:hypothetical protein ACFQ07_10485, partial [Actinomadura adrarensis]
PAVAYGQDGSLAVDGKVYTLVNAVELIDVAAHRTVRPAERWSVRGKLVENWDLIGHVRQATGN